MSLTLPLLYPKKSKRTEPNENGAPRGNTIFRACGLDHEPVCLNKACWSPDRVGAASPGGRSLIGPDLKSICPLVAVALLGLEKANGSLSLWFRQLHKTYLVVVAACDH